MVVLLWLLGRRLPAVVLLGVLVIATGASLRFPAVASALDRVTRSVQRVAAAVLTFVMLIVIQLLVFTPIALVLRLVRRDPLSPGGNADQRSLWRAAPRASGRPLYRRQFAYERRAAGDEGARGRRRLGRPGVVLGLLAILVLLDVAVGALLHAGDQAGNVRAAVPNLSLLPSANVPAGRAEPWAKTLGLELGHVYYGQRYDPYLGWVMPDYNGRYVHVVGGIRRSYQAPDSQAKGAIQVFFFGGSSMFGVFQRDEETIPSQFARLAAADGIPVKVWNFGQIAYVNWQEVLQFQELLSSGHVPSLAVFYDGANELISQFRLGPHTVPSNVQARAFAELLPFGGVSSPAAAPAQSPLAALYHAWANVSAVNWLSRTLRGVPTVASTSSQLTLPPWAGNQRQQAAQAGADAATVYLRGVDLARRLALSYHVKTAFLWQPILYSKRPVANELQAPELLGTDPVAWRRAYGLAQTRLQRPVIDIANALNSVTSPIMYDFVHTNEAGANVVARVIYQRVLPTLRELYRSRRG